MTDETAAIAFERRADGGSSLSISGDWTQGHPRPDFAAVERGLSTLQDTALVVHGEALGAWDSALVAFLLQCHHSCELIGVELQLQHMPDGVSQLLALATAVPPHQRPSRPAPTLWQQLSPRLVWCAAIDALYQTLYFAGEVTHALARLAAGRAATRWRDFRDLCYQAGPDAFAIISLTGVLVGMILAYLGAVQLQQFGAGIYVADLVVIGMLREMGALMTAVVMAGRTGAAYAAQLGTMQTNDEIDAITTMGISPMEFLVLPRMLALIVIMPLLTVYADVLGIVGGGLVAGGLGITPLQYINEGLAAISPSHIWVGLGKSVVFAALISVAGCRAGINSGRSSAAVGRATTEAVVTAIIYLIVADAAINILCQQVQI